MPMSFLKIKTLKKECEKMVIGKHRNTKAIVDLKAIAKNIQLHQSKLAENQTIFAVVKANGYGHGMLQVAEVAAREGVTGFCVALADEAFALREAGFSQTIIILGIARVEDCVELAKEHISVTVSSLDWLKEAEKRLLAANVKGMSLPVHIACDTGMGRIGIHTGEELEAMVRWITQSKVLTFEGMFTHFACADDPNQTHANTQYDRFKQLVEQLSVTPQYIHCANSAWTAWHGAKQSQIIRLGISMYGLNPSNGDWEFPYELSPALRLESEIVFVKQLHAGDTISYGATYTCSEDEWIATIPIGYADGWLRVYHSADVLVDGKRCPIVGRICMDQMMIRLPKPYPIGTKVTLIGKDQDEEITAEEISHHGKTIHYEVLCGLSERVPREYV